MNNAIAIAGMGWLGQAFAQHLIVLGYRVKGSVTTAEKAAEMKSRGFDVYPVVVTESGVQGEVQVLLQECKVLFIMIPPGLRRNTGADHVLKMRHFLKEVERSEVEKVVLVSSTSVYDDSQGTVTEKDLPRPTTDSGRQLFQVEQLFFNAPFLSTSIVRFGGLLGGSRQPVRYLSGRTDLNDGAAPVNLIHREDCIGILSEIIKQEAYGHVFNAVAPQHPAKKDYYIQKAKELQLEPPHFSEEETQEIFKQVDSVNVPHRLRYTFKHSI
ncbi:NAD(P)H-binding protein [Altibacter sp.]|uniref:NAD(P)-binding domain-containing protein n=1 Tax=Altibacter sp. TaxID=2024823 RepID=UPI000C8B225D|nr:NAD(P)H-binding protein [Altibacter sp.]MAP54219.1 NAD(P)-dependent oxidoreductase [Altibacter sp.]